MPVKLGVAVVVLVAATAACVVVPSEDEPSEGAPSSLVSALRTEDSDQPMPLDHPVPTVDRSLRPPTPAFDIFFGVWEPSPRIVPDCYVKFATIYDPGRDRKVEVPITVCD